MLVIVFCSTVDGVDGGACSDLSYTKWVGLMQFDIFGVSRQKNRVDVTDLWEFVPQKTTAHIELWRGLP